MSRVCKHGPRVVDRIGGCRRCRDQIEGRHANNTYERELSSH